MSLKIPVLPPYSHHLRAESFISLDLRLLGYKVVMVLTQQECTIIDGTFGPHAGDCRGGLDFTLLFEDTILCILPLVAVIFASVIRLMFLSKRSIKVISSHLISSKMVSVLNPPRLADKTTNHRHSRLSMPHLPFFSWRSLLCGQILPQTEQKQQPQLSPSLSLDQQSFVLYRTRSIVGLLGLHLC